MFSGKKSAFNIILIPYLQADNMDDENFKQCLTGRPWYKLQITKLSNSSDKSFRNGVKKYQENIRGII